MKRFFLFFFLIFCLNVFSENINNQKKYFFYLKSFKYNEAKEIAKQFNDSILKSEAISLANILLSHRDKDGREDLSREIKDNTVTKVIINLKKGYLELFKNPNSTKPFNYFNESLKISKFSNNNEAYKFSLISIFLIYNKQVEQTNNEHQKMLNSFKNLLKDKEDTFHFYLNTLYYDLRRINREHILDEVFFNKFNKLINKFEINHPFWVYYYSILGVYYRVKGINKSEEYLKKSLVLIKYPFQKHLSLRGNIHLSHLYKKKEKYNIALNYLNEAEKYIDKNDSLKLTYFLNLYKADVFQKKGDFKNAIRFLNVSVKQKNQLDYLKNNIEISNLNIKYQTEKKEKENLQLRQNNIEIEQKRKKNLYYLIASILTLILTGIIATLTLKNSKRKRKLAEQDKALETQKNLTLLKEQEITTINAMVDGQEKERKRIAEDLHDNLGSVLATLKLHFENLKINSQKKKINQETLFDKTEGLIDEAYLKVRSIAHAKNSGVIANQGLLLAVQLMAEKISSADKIKIEVVHFGLDKRLENSLELTIFRIIQELVTNIIKHAEAKNATINIAAYDKNLNIIIEDDGKGFDIKKVNLKNGMGISSIKTRVEHLKGTFEVDATLGKGSSIILDIPIS